MTPTKIDLLGDNYFLISHPAVEKESDAPSLFDGVTVNLYPSLVADFRVNSYTKSRPVRNYDPSAAICAAAHLSVVRGLPLDEFEFEAPTGILRIFHTCDGFFSLTIHKCKVLFTETVDIFGCDVRYTDVSVDRVYRIVHTDNASLVDKSALLPLLSVGKVLPDALLFSSVVDSELFILPYTDYNPSPPPRLLLLCAAAYSYFGKYGALSADGGALFAEVGNSTVSLKIKCEIK